MGLDKYPHCLSRYLDGKKTKGQLNSEWIFEVIVSPKMATKIFKDFCPGSLLLQG